ncbi:MAG: hypothetical protein K9J75_05280 [Cyanobium usitatum Tobar12.5m-G36]|nr:hypothetical protein [Cyanobium usitatum Tobar12.5m-G36]
MEASKVVESVKLLLSSVKKLTDSFLTTEVKFTHMVDRLTSDVHDLLERMERLEKQLLNLRESDQQTGQPQRKPELPVTPESKEMLIPRLNLPLESLLDVYANAPSLLEPFSRPCNITSRTLLGEINEIELEASTQGTTWVLESLDGSLLLVPRPGTLERRNQLETIDRIYKIKGVKELPVLLQLIQPARAVVVQYGRRWQLSQKGMLSVNPDPLRVSTAERLLKLENRLANLEASNG